MRGGGTLGQDILQQQYNEATTKTENDGVQENKTILGFPGEVFKVYLFDQTIPQEYGDGRPKDALRICPGLINRMYVNDSIPTEKELKPIDDLMDTFYEYGYLPREPYIYDPSIQYVTSMDAPLLALASEYAYDRTGIEKYHKYMEDLIPYILKDTSEKGFILKLNDDEWWPLEYAFDGVTQDNAWYVYNGSLYATLAIQILAQHTGDERLFEVVEKATNAYKHFSDKFYYDDRTWCYYALNSYTNEGKVIDFYEKVWIERTACEALYVVTGDTFYNDEAINRRKFTTDFYPCYLIKSEDKAEVCFLRAGAPHPYYIDIVHTWLEILDEDGRVLCENDCDIRNVEGAYMSFTVPSNAKYYRWYERYNRELLFEGELKTIDQNEVILNNQDIAINCWGDAFKKDNETFLNSAIDEGLQGWFTFDLQNPVKNGLETYYIIEVNNPTQIELPVIIRMYDAEGFCIARYSKIGPGMNSVIFHYAGFTGYSDEFKETKVIELGIVSDLLPEEDIEFKFGNVYIADKTAQVVNYLSEHSYSDFWVWDNDCIVNGK